MPILAKIPNAIYANAATKKTRLLIGTGTSDKSSSKGIYETSWNAATGELGEISLAAELESPTFLAVDGRQRNLFAISEIDAGKVTAFHLEHGGSLALKMLNSQSAEGNGPAHVSVNVDGGSVFVSNYGGGSLTSYKVEADGKLSAPVSHFQTVPVDGLPEHVHPHIHEATPSLDGKWLLVNDLGSDRIWIYRIDNATGTLTPAKIAFWQGRDKSGPRHLAFHPNGRWVYSVNELDSTVDHLLWDEEQGKLTTIGSFISTLAPEFPKNTAFASEILVSPDGKFAYVGNRRNETIARLDLDASTGAPKLAQLIAHGGRTARHITLDPSGKFLLVALQDSGAVVVLGRDKKTGVLSGPLHSYSIDSPQCLIFTT